MFLIHDYREENPIMMRKAWLQVVERNGEGTQGVSWGYKVSNFTPVMFSPGSKAVLLTGNHMFKDMSLFLMHTIILWLLIFFKVLYVVNSLSLHKCSFLGPLSVKVHIWSVLRTNRVPYNHSFLMLPLVHRLLQAMAISKWGHSLFYRHNQLHSSMMDSKGGLAW